ncbi:Scarecrow-like protein 28 [Heracleum sosnowskyi]|uniref:Scarecrow-like protein 28 n=1 Tax=Heracleum sosnowskyi TaxID=360622 RepID=A0AAD8HYG5_9APIA|nr:Scarecrow-like protein 28 [Heracleum sosnowskyi]
MLAGCPSTLLSPRHRLRSEASAQFQACNFPSMSTQRLELPCSFTRKESSRSQSVRSVVNLSIEKPAEARTSNCSLKKSISLPPLTTTGQLVFHDGKLEKKDEFRDKSKNRLKRFADENFFEEDDSSINVAKKRRGSRKYDDSLEGGENLGLDQLWFHPSFEVPTSVSRFTGLNPQQTPFSLVCSEEEDTCFAPSKVTSPPLPLPNNPWADSIVTEFPKLGERNVEPSQGLAKQASSSTSSGSDNNLAHGLHDNASEHEVGNASRSHNLNESAGFVAGSGDNNGNHDEFELVSLLMACINAIDLKNIEGVHHYIAKLGELASPRGSSISRLTAYFTEALALRVARVWPHIFYINTLRELNSVEDESGTALRLLNQVSPIPQFIHFTGNEILLRGFEGKDRVHVIDFDIKQGLQWPSFFQSLASRGKPPSHVRITGIGESKQDLIETGERLAGFAEALNLQFEFHPVVDRLEDVRLWMLHVKEGECVAVNCIFQLHKMLYDGNGGPLMDFMGLLRSTNPKIVVMAEQEADHNYQSLETRLCNSLKYYAAIFDSLDLGLPQDSLARIKVEEMFAREIKNIISCEGRDRLERHENFGKWAKLMESGGFRNMGITEREFLQSRMLLKMYPFDDYRVEKQVRDDSSALTLSWSDQSLYTVSAWAPLDIAGSSTSQLT